jgi:3-hydroxyisobutyrate dehydrogenase-like beta-hydroxyacid dehydrogenase
MDANDAMPQNRRGFLQVAGAAATAFSFVGLPSSAPAAGEATGKMKIGNVGVMSPGDMGQAMAAQLKAEGFNVYCALERRSERTRGLARAAGLIDVGSVARLVAECDVVLSIMDPGAALDFASEVADALHASGRRTLIVDCNAIAPETVRAIAAVVQEAGGRFLDAGIIGPPPRGGAKTNLFVSGPGAADLEQIAGPQIVVQAIGEGIADASALKMCYGAITKGTQAVWLEALVAAERLGVAGILETQLQQSQADRYHWALGQFPGLPPKAYRWVPEMLEISKTLSGVGMTPQMYLGAADVYRFVAATPLGKEAPETRDKARQGKDVVRLLAQARTQP